MTSTVPLTIKTMTEFPAKVQASLSSATDEVPLVFAKSPVTSQDTILDPSIDPFAPTVLAPKKKTKKSHVKTRRCAARVSEFQFFRRGDKALELNEMPAADGTYQCMKMIIDGPAVCCKMHENHCPCGLVTTPLDELSEVERKKALRKKPKKRTPKKTKKPKKTKTPKKISQIAIIQDFHSFLANFDLDKYLDEVDQQVTLEEKKKCSDIWKSISSLQNAIVREVDDFVQGCINEQ